QVIECSLAKPQADGKGEGSAQKSALLPSYPPRMGYGLGTGAYGGIGAGYGGAGFGQNCGVLDTRLHDPLIYGRGPTPSGMAMMPMLLPDGRIGYVLQQPGPQAHTQPPPPQRSGRSGGGSSGGRQNNDSNRGRRYRPY
ncbi:heterogeneous nuclear ribonucleoprotein R-like, partial [Thalictrum thalictroides]